MRWTVAVADKGIKTRLMEELKLPSRLAEILAIRGRHDLEEVQNFLEPRLQDLPDPSTLADMDRASERLAKAIQEGEKIAIYGDYDVDGVTSASLLSRFFESVGTQAEIFVPDRFVDGYGLNGQRISELVADGAQVLISVDCGTANPKEVALAQDAGCDVIVVDHHKVPENHAKPFAMLNPMRPDCTFEFSRLAAVGVAFFLAIGTRRALRNRSFFSNDRPEPQLRELMELVALGTVADVMPLTHLNRVLVTHGLKSLNHRPSVGMRALCESSGLHDRPVTSTDLGFKLGPRINAAGRMTHARGGVELLTTSDGQIARGLAQRLNQENQSRRDTEKGVLDAALIDAKERVEQGAMTLVLYQPDWHLGVVGIVAARIREAYHRPTFILGRHPEDGCIKGSGRSISGFDLVAALDGAKEVLQQYGGHAHAAGVTLSEDRFEAFRERFEAIGRESLDEDQLVPELKVDSYLEISEVGLPLFDTIERMAPFGAGNPRPVFAFKNVQVANYKFVGDGSHVSMNLDVAGQKLRGIAFGKADQAELLKGPVDLAVRLTENYWRGSRSAEFQVRDIRASKD